MASLPLTAGDPERVGPYRLLSRLGQGGMGRVYLGRSPGGHAVAVKVVREALLRDERFRQRFVREVAAARRVTGYFTAEVVDADPEGSPAWLATEYIPGQSLQHAVARHGSWPEPAVRRLGAALAEALTAVHAVDLVHRDLKPSNVLLAPDGPRVIDFGIAAAAGDSTLTGTGMVIGTPGFIPPEQLRHEMAGPAGDVFALGAVLAYAAAGVGPFGGGAAHAVNYRVVHQDPDLRGLAPALTDVVGRCLAKDPRERPALSWLLGELGHAERAGWLPGPVAESAARMRAEVPTEPLPGAGDTVPQSSASPTPPRTRRRRLRTVLATATAVAVAVTGTVVWKVAAGEDDRPPAEPSNIRELWERPLEKGQRTAVTTQATVYLQNEDRHEITALSGTDGSERWGGPVAFTEIRPEDEDYLKEIVGDGVEVTAVSGGQLYYGSGRYLYALDADNGEPLWKYHDHSFHPAPVAEDGAAYAHLPGVFYVLDTRTGKALWHHTFGSGTTRGLTVSGGTVLVHDGRKLIAVDTGTRKRKWTYEGDSDAQTLPAVANGKAYFGTVDGTLYAVDLESGDEVWRRAFEGELWDGRLGEGASRPEVVDGTVYFENDAYVSAFDADTGRPRWRKKRTADEVTALTVVDGTVLTHDSDGYLSALDTRGGDLRWRERLIVGEGEDLWLVGSTVYVERVSRLTAYRATT
ncbi:serine/threonine-protein kinase [Streptomyces sp. NPDC053780]|uniref:serine/threonine-protein kinase n=1 Tax=unclassified Streptomyces TaxID=2593676 RepID=UPI0034298E3F